MPLGAGTAWCGARDRDAGKLAALDFGSAAGMSRLLVPAGADVAVGGYMPILPFFARESQEAGVSIFATGENRAFSASDRCGQSGKNTRAGERA